MIVAPCEAVIASIIQFWRIGCGATGFRLNESTVLISSRRSRAASSTPIGKVPATIGIAQYGGKNFFPGNVPISSFTGAFPTGQAFRSTRL